MSVVMDVKKATEEDLEELNSVITDAVMQWVLPDRVKRLSLPSFHYDALDVQHMDIRIARNHQHTIIAIIATEMTDSPGVILLHGIFVRSSDQRRGVGTLLLRTVEQNLSASMVKSLLVKPQKEAIDFFHALGFEHVTPKHKNQYENLMRKTL